MLGYFPQNFGLRDTTKNLADDTKNQRYKCYSDGKAMAIAGGRGVGGRAWGWVGGDAIFSSCRDSALDSRCVSER